MKGDASIPLCTSGTISIQLTWHPGGRHNIRCRHPSSKLFV